MVYYWNLAWMLYPTKYTRWYTFCYGNMLGSSPFPFKIKYYHLQLHRTKFTVKNVKEKTQWRWDWHGTTEIRFLTSQWLVSGHHHQSVFSLVGDSKVLRSIDERIGISLSLRPKKSFIGLGFCVSPKWVFQYFKQCSQWIAVQESHFVCRFCCLHPSPSSKLCEAFARSLKTGWILSVICVKW